MYQTFYDQALALAEAADRVPEPILLGGAITNLWQDSSHLRGIWRRTTPAVYATPAPDWSTVAGP